MSDLELIRGDRATLTLHDLLDGEDAPAALDPAEDVLIWTAKLRYAETDAEAFLQLRSDSAGGIAIAGDGQTATVTVLASDWQLDSLTRDQRFVWDIQVAVGGDPDQIVTLDRGEGLLRADATLSVPA